MLSTYDHRVPLSFVCLSLSKWHMPEKSTKVKFGLFVLAVDWKISSGSCDGSLAWRRGSQSVWGRYSQVCRNNIFMIIIIKDTRIIQDRFSKRGIIGGNVQEARLLATFIDKGASQHWLGSLSTIQFYAHHGGSLIADRFQNKLRWPYLGYIDCTFNLVLSVVEGKNLTLYDV